MTALALALLLLAGAAGSWLWTPGIDRATLQARYAGPPSRFIDVLPGLRLHVRDSGPRDAPALLLLHGFGSSLHVWDDWAAGLQATHRVVRFDLPGAGLTVAERVRDGTDGAGNGAPDSNEFSDERAVQAIAALMDGLGLQRATIVGHSMGGRLAWRFAATRPDRVDRLVLVAPDGFASAPPPALPPGAPWLLRHALPRALIEQGLRAAWADPRMLDEARVTQTHELLLAPGVRQAQIERLQQQRQQPTVDPVPLLQRIQAPTLLLWGAQDALIPVGQAAGFLRALSDARLVVLPAVGHIPQEEAPHASLAALRSFMAGAALQQAPLQPAKAAVNLPAPPAAHPVPP